MIIIRLGIPFNGYFRMQMKLYLLAMFIVAIAKPYNDIARFCMGAASDYPQLQRFTSIAKDWPHLETDSGSALGKTDSYISYHHEMNCMPA